MTELAQLLQREHRRHGAISGALLLAAVAAGTMITNERGVFSVLSHGPLSALERAFAALVDGDGARPGLFGGPVYRPGGFYPAGGVRPLRDGVAPAPNALPGNALPGILDRAITPDGVGGQPGQDGVVGGDGGPGIGGVGGGPGGGPALVGVGGTPTDTTPIVPGAPVPEPAIWALMIGGLGLVGATLRRGTARRRRLAFRAAE